MQLFVNVGKCWKCVEVDLVNGCVPCIGGAALPDQRIEPAQWFKVLVLDSVCVDCDEHVVSWTITSIRNSGHGAIEDGLGNKISLTLPADSVSVPSEVADSTLSDTASACMPEDNDSPILSLNQSLCDSSLDGNHSLMAAHDDTICKDDLQALFELAQTLFGQSTSPQGIISPAKQQSTEWLQLLHCYLLPLITFHHEDLNAVSEARNNHMQLLCIIDQHMEEISLATLKLKDELATLFSSLLPHLEKWAVQNVCSSTFLSLVTSDIRRLEQEARAKIQSCARNIEFNERLGTHTSQSFRERFLKEKITAEQELLEMLKLRSILEGTVALLDGHQVEGSEMQIQYVHLHMELDQLRKKSATLSSDKVLALSVREAFELTVSYLVSGHATSGMDVGLQGGHSTDVLMEASPSSDTSNYLTWREKIQKLLQVQWSPLAQLHHQFSHKLNVFLFSSASDSPKDKMEPGISAKTKSLALLVNQHYEKIVDSICVHFDDHNQDFVQRVYLCYEKVFFESFSNSIFSLYQTEQMKDCQQLMTNAIGLSVIDPQCLELGIVDKSWLHLFPPRPFSSASLLYKQVAGSSDLLSCALKKEFTSDLPYMKYFSGVSSDLFSLPSAISPLDRLQLLISAFRKAMAGLSRVKLEDHNPSSVGSLRDPVPTAVNCDEILPVLVLLMLHLPPWLLGILHINCCLLADFMAPFLSPGWHGYSLATFTSILHVINKL